MKIGFLLGSPDIGGGTNVILEHAAGLLHLGNEVSIVTQTPVEPHRYAWHTKASLLTWQAIEEAQRERFDCLIATWWESPYLLEYLEASHYVYFVQSIESRFFAPDDPKNLDLRDHSLGADRCDHGYFFSLPVITEARWIQHYLQQEYNHQPYLVRNGIDKALYAEQETICPKIPGKLRVLVEGPVEVFHKNVPRTIDLCREAGVDEIWLLTPSRLTHYPGVDRIFSQVPHAQTPTIYRSCDVLVKLSYVEGMFGPPLEMFHCGGTAIVYDVTGADEYITDNVNGLVIAKDQEHEVIDSLRHLRESPDLLQRLSSEAMNTAATWPDWQEATKSFAKALLDISERPAIHRNYLRNISGVFRRHQQLQLVAREVERFAERENIDTAQQEGHDNFVQLYVYSKGHLVHESWAYYTTGTTCTCTLSVEMSAPAGQIRLDPSVRFGIIHLYRITIRDEKNTLATYSPEDGFERLFLTGTAKWLVRDTSCWLIESFGNDPQLVLPEIEIAKQKTITVDISLKEVGFSHYMATRERQSKKGNTPLSLRFWRKPR